MNSKRTGATSQGRRLYIDNLRVFLIVLVIAVHVSIAYGGSGSWSYQEPTNDVLTGALLTMFNAVSQSFFMGLFFMIAGYFTPGSFDRKGARGFLADRFVRLGIPLVVYVLLLNPVVVYEYLVRHGETQLGFLQFWVQCFVPPRMQFIGTGPLWFVQTLLMFTLAYAALRWFLAKRAARSAGGRRDGTEIGGAGARGSSKAAPSNAAILSAAVALGALSFVARLWFPVDGWNLFGMQLGFYPQYIVLFSLGVVAYRRGWLDNLSEKTGRLWLKIAAAGVLALPAVLVAGGALSGDAGPFQGGLHWQALAYAMWEQIVGVAFCIALLYVFRKRFDFQGRLARSMSANAYTAYIIQAPVIIAVQLAMSGLALHPLLKFAVVTPMAVAACFAVSHFAVRRLPMTAKVL